MTRDDMEREIKLAVPLDRLGAQLQRVAQCHPQAPWCHLSAIPGRFLSNIAAPFAESRASLANRRLASRNSHVQAMA
jgi:hypothetical protein